MNGGYAAPTVLHAFPTFAVGGAQMRFAAVANRFGPAYRHVIHAASGDYAAARHLGPAVAAAYPALPSARGGTLGHARRFRQVLAELRPDVLVTYNWGSIEWAIANALPLARHIHIEDGFGPEERDRQIRRRVLTRRVCLRRATVVLPSRTLWRIATGGWRLDPRRLRYVPNGVDLGRFRPDAPGPVPLWPGEGRVIGTVATLRAEKNVARLIRAFARLAAPARLVVAGDGPERSRLQALAGELELGARVHFPGAVHDPAPLYRSFDLFALSSDTEQMPLSVLEAMASGLPVAATDVGDVRDMLPGPCQAFVTPRDGEALSGALASLLRRPDRGRELGALNRARAVREYGQEAMFQAHAALLDGRDPAA